MNIKPYIIFFCLTSYTTFGSSTLINGRPAGDLFPGVGTFDLGCTITKVGEKQFITAAHCIRRIPKKISLNFKTFKGKVEVKSLHIHPSWTKDCSDYPCDGTEVGSSRMTPGRADVAFINVKTETPKIPVIEVNYERLDAGSEVAMVGAGCTRGVEPGGRDSMRYAISEIVPHTYLVHEHSLYRNISEITGESNWVTLGYKTSREEASLCPGDSGGPLLVKAKSGAWQICGIAADYTFDGPYQDGIPTITNLHTRLDNQSLHSVGNWIRSNWDK